MSTIDLIRAMAMTLLCVPQAFAQEATAPVEHETAVAPRDLPQLPRLKTPRNNSGDDSSASDGTWVTVCIGELRYVNLGGPYGLSGYGDDRDGDTVHFAIGKTGVRLSRGAAETITPVVLPATEWFTPVELPDIWGFLREAASAKAWIEFYAWPPDGEGVQSVTQIRRLYPSATGCGE